MTATLDLHRARLLVRWLQARRAQQEVLDALLAYGPVAEQRVAERLDLLRRLELVARARFDDYLAAVTHPPVDALAGEPVVPGGLAPGSRVGPRETGRREAGSAAPRNSEVAPGATRGLDAAPAAIALPAAAPASDAAGTPQSDREPVGEAGGTPGPVSDGARIYALPRPDPVKSNP